MKRRKLSPKAKKNIRTVNYGLAGNIAGTVVGHKLGHARHGARIGTGVGLAVGSAVEAKLAKKGVPEQSATNGAKKFKSRVGTKTNGRVNKKDNPFVVKKG